MLSERHDLAAPVGFFKQAIAANGVSDRVVYLQKWCKPGRLDGRERDPEI
jgi:hypothetical protein